MAHAARNVESRETHRLIGSDKVEGTNVYRPAGDKIGQIDRVMIDKRSGKVAYAVMGFGGFLGIGDDHYPLPWSALTYNERLDGYEVNVTDEQLEKTPPREGTGEFYDADWEERVHRHYGVTPYWM